MSASPHPIAPQELIDRRCRVVSIGEAARSVVAELAARMAARSTPTKGHPDGEESQAG